MECLIIGGGIGGLTTALSLHAAGIAAKVVEAAPALAPLGVGINVLPQATRELCELGLQDQLDAVAIRTQAFVILTRDGREVFREPRGLAAGYRWPQYSIHRGELQMILLQAVRERLGPDAVQTGLALQRFEQQGDRVVAELREHATGAVRFESADVLVGADGLHSATRAQLHPDMGPPVWNGVHMWRGATEFPPFLGGETMVSIGVNERAKLVAYPISKAAHARGSALVNWIAEAKLGGNLETPPDWNRTARVEDVVPHYEQWRFPLFDVTALMKQTEHIWWYPMVDRDPLERWGDGRVTLLGDAAHPMHPTGSNGGTQAIVDARVLAWNLATQDDPVAAIQTYEANRRERTNAIVHANRVGAVAQTQRYKELAGFDVGTLNAQPSWSVPR